MPILEERVRLDPREVAADTVRLTTRVETREETIEVSLEREHVDVERVAIGRFVDAAPPTRQEGDVTIVSVVEEVLVVEKRLVLKEEWRLTRRRTQETETRTVALRRERVEVARPDADTDEAGATAPVDPRTTHPHEPPIFPKTSRRTP